MAQLKKYLMVLGMFGVLGQGGFARPENSKLFLVKAWAYTTVDRDRIAGAGVAIDQVLSDSVVFIGTAEDIGRVKTLGIKTSVTALPNRNWDFPTADSDFHSYDELMKDIDHLATNFPQIVSKESLGKSVEGRELMAVRLSASPDKDSLPAILFFGCHHAREHLSVEIPFKLAQYLAQEYGKNPRVTELLRNREIWVAPMINPDGADYDTATGSYRFWRKNRRDNKDGTFGVDLNRNYGGKGWGGPGSSASTSSDIYRGPEPFSEPETMAVRDFVRSRKTATILLSFHTFSELILWPWGHTHDAIDVEKDRLVFETMGKTMAQWNHYTAQKSSQLYLASGDTTDWAYSELNIFAFTFELSPKSLFDGGFYPGAKAIEPTFKANLEPTLYLIERAGNPYEVLESQRTDPLNIL